MFKDPSLYQQKLEEMLRIYQLVAPDCWNQRQAYERVVKHAAPRFYILPHTLYVALYQVLNGKTKGFKFSKPVQLRMYEELLNRVIRKSQDPAYEGWSLYKLCEETILEPAPEFYCEPNTFRQMLYVWRKARRKKQ